MSHTHAVLTELPVVAVTEFAALFAAPPMPVPHPKHDVSALLPLVVVEYVPIAQSVHAVAAATAEYLPAPQAKHSPTTVAPAVARYVPAAQAVHVMVAAEPDDAEPQNPLAHWQLETAEAVPSAGDVARLRMLASH